jgi:hypothetical protein
VTPDELIQGVQAAAERFPGCVLVKNDVGNLAIMWWGSYVGFIDLGSGEFVNLLEAGS